MVDPNERISVEEALDRVLSHVGRLGGEQVGLDEALGRVLARDVTSDIDVSPFDNSSMDGYAVRREDIASASEQAPVTLKVVATIGAGGVYERELESGQTVRLMTGAPVPAGCDAVVKYEIVGVERGDGGAGSLVSFTAPAKPNANIRFAGEEFKAGETVLRAGCVLTPYAIGMLASAGCVNPEVIRRPVVGVFSIGSELVASPQVPTPGMIRDCNTPCIAALVRDAGAQVRTYPIVADDPQAIADSLAVALGECDMVISAGGASKGDFDFINAIIESQGEVLFSYLSLRPGKRQTMGVVDGKPVFGLSGNPAAASVGFELLIRPALRKMQGFSCLERPTLQAELAQGIRKKEGRRFYQRGLVERAQDGGWYAREYGTQSSALLGDLERCNCLIMVPEESMGMEAGERVTCIRIDMPEGAQL